MPAHLPITLQLYRLSSRAAAPAARRLLMRRLQRGKEHPQRLPERRGEASLPRPAGPLIWLNAASVGEMLSVVPLIERIRAQNFAVLLTSGTVSAAGLAAQRLPPGTLHQFIPLDAPQFVARFLDHWRPDLALFVEADLWPNLILDCAARRIPMILVNGRVSARSFGRWRRLPGTIAALLARFELCLAQSSLDAQRYGQLGAPRVTITGNLKLDVPPPAADRMALQRLATLIGVRQVIVAASTHPGEENTVLAAHRRLRAKSPSLLTVIAPRHAERGPAIAEMAQAAGLSAALRSRGELPKREVEVYVADTFGELGLIYRLASIVFVGGSLASHGGQNPIEPIRLGAAVLHGPHVWNFGEIYAALDAAHGAELVGDEDALTARLSDWLNNPAARASVFDAGSRIVDALGGALESTLAALDPYLMQLRLQQRAS